MMQIHSKLIGSGARPLVLIHGWALNSRVWDNLITELSKTRTVICLDLPGHGKSPHSDSDSPYTLATVSDAIAQHLQAMSLPQAPDILGWSLGGMCAARMAHDYPEQMNKLVLLASSPQFVQSTDWHQAVAVEVLENFAADLIRDYRNTILRFLAIQSLGSPAARDQIRQLKEKIFINGEPGLNALQGGLDILKNDRLQDIYRDLSCPTLLLLGEKDTLIPVQSGEPACAMIRDCHLEIITGAGHAPFLSHPQQFTSTLIGFLDS